MEAALSAGPAKTLRAAAKDEGEDARRRRRSAPLLRLVMVLVLRCGVIVTRLLIHLLIAIVIAIVIVIIVVVSVNLRSRVGTIVYYRTARKKG